MTLMYETYRSVLAAFALIVDQLPLIVVSFGFQLQGISVESAEKGILRLIQLVLDDDNGLLVFGTLNSHGSNMRYTTDELNPVAATLSCVCSSTPDLLLVSATAELLRLPIIIHYIPLAAFCPVLAESSSPAPVHQGVRVECIMKHPITRCDGCFFVHYHEYFSIVYAYNCIAATDLLAAGHSVGLLKTRQIPTASHFGGVV